MPVLAQEPSLYPESLLDGASGESSDRRWWVLQTKARQEKAVARQLLGYQIPFYLPVIKKTSIYRRRRVTSGTPLFASYLFLFGSEEERIRSLTTNRITRILSVADADRLRHDLRQIQHLIASNAPLTVESRLETGNRVRVRRGALGGLEGTVLTRRGQTRLLVAVDFLQQGASIEIDDFLLEPLG